MDSPDAFVGPVNLGNTSDFIVRELAKKVILIAGSSSKITYHPTPFDDPTRRQPDIALTNEKLSWAPTVSLDEGLIQTIKYYDALLSGNEVPY